MLVVNLNALTCAEMHKTPISIFAWPCYAIPDLTIGGWGHTKVLELSPMASQYERAMNVNEEGVVGVEAL